jgi:hypothetical protein
VGPQRRVGETLMLLSAVSPLDGLPINELIKTFRQLKVDLNNASGGNAQALERYQRWANLAARTLSFYVAPEDVERLILTRRHWVLVELQANMQNNWLISDLLDAEREDRGRLFEAEIKALEEIQKAWTDRDSKVIAADSNVYIHHEEYFYDIDWRALADYDEVRLLIPMQVVRELDRQKRAGRNVPVSKTNPELVSTRARHTNKRIRDVFEDVSSIVGLQPGVTAELLLDPVGHIGISDGDTEIIDRVRTAKQLLNRSVAIVTGDGNMQLGAKVAGLDVITVET